MGPVDVDPRHSRDGGRVGLQVKSGSTPLNRDDYRDFDGTVYLFAASGQYHGAASPRCVCLDPAEMRAFVAGHLGLLATVGATTVTVVRRPVVGVLSTGDELVMPGRPLPPGAIYNSNRFMLGALLRGQGCEVTDLGNVPDRLDATRAALREAARGHDLILSSGGVSVGEEDHLKPALAAEGRLDLWSLAIKPGKPLAFGAVRREGGETWFIGLPGNPVSSYVTFVLFVRPVLRRLQSATALVPAPLPVRADFAWEKPGNRREFLRVRRNAAGGLELFSNQGSGVLTSLAWGDGLADIAPGRAVRPGRRFPVLARTALRWMLRRAR